MRIAVIGAGVVGSSITRRATAAGHSVDLASARGPRELAAVASRLGARAVTVAEAGTAELVLLAVPWLAVPDVLGGLPPWQGRIVVDATNPFIAFDPLRLAELGGRSASVIVAGHAPGARVVKAFNSITMADFEMGPVQGEARRVLFVSGDDDAAKAQVRQLIDSLGYATIDLGDLELGGRLQQAGGPLAGRDLLLNSEHEPSP